MILDRTEQADLYTSLNPHFAKAFAFLRQEGLDKLKEGRHDIDGDGLYALVVRGTCKPPSQAKLELHRKYIDVQFLISGCDNIGWKNSQLCKNSKNAYLLQHKKGKLKNENNRAKLQNSNSLKHN